MDDQHVIPATQPAQASQENGGEKNNTRTVIIGVVIGILILAGIIAAVIALLSSTPDTTSKLRDIFIIFMAFEFLLVGIALIILMIQLATLINLLQNEVKPILLSTQETVSTLRGTVTFLGDHMVEPVIKLNSYLAGLKRVLDLFSAGRK